MLRILILVIVLSAAAFAQTQPPPYHCAQDADIDAMRRALVESAATKFVRTILSGDPGSAWDTMTPQGQQSITRDQFAANALLTVLPAQPRNLAFQHTFLIHVVGTPAPGARITCGPDVTDPTQSFSMAVVAAPEQAYTLISADGATNGLVFTLWLLRDDSGWRVNSFASNTSTFAGKDAVAVWQLARDQHQHGHDFNATLLYVAAAQIASRGPDLSLGISGEIAKDQAQAARPKELSGPPPFLFEEKGKTYSIQSIGATDLGGRIFLGLAHEVPAWKSEKQADSWNRELISLIKKRFPEYSDVFSGILVQARERGTGRTLTTADEQPGGRESP